MERGHLKRLGAVFYPLISAMLVLVVGCSSVFFTPGTQLSQTPSQFELAYRDVYIHPNKDKDLTLHGWFLPLPQSADVEIKGTVYLLHGNSHNISDYVETVFWLPAAGYQVFLLDYRGFGQSEGKAKLPGVFDDIEAGFRWLEKQPTVTGKPIFVIGQSIGAALSGYLFSSSEDLKSGINGLVLDCGFSRYDDMAQLMWQRHWTTWLFQLPVRWMVDSRYNPESEIANLSPVPLLMFHSADDRVVNYAQGEALYQAAAQPKEFVSSHGPHIKTFTYPKYQDKLLLFFEENLK